MDVLKETGSKTDHSYHFEKKLMKQELPYYFLEVDASKLHGGDYAAQKKEKQPLKSKLQRNNVTTIRTKHLHVPTCNNARTGNATVITRKCDVVPSSPLLLPLFLSCPALPACLSSLVAFLTSIHRRPSWEKVTEVVVYESCHTRYVCVVFACSFLVSDVLFGIIPLKCVLWCVAQSWNVYGHEQKQKVKKDEAEHATEENARQEKIREEEGTFRLETMRNKAKKREREQEESMDESELRLLKQTTADRAQQLTGMGLFAKVSAQPANSLAQAVFFSAEDAENSQKKAKKNKERTEEEKQKEIDWMKKNCPSSFFGGCEKDEKTGQAPWYSVSNEKQQLVEELVGEKKEREGKSGWRKPIKLSEDPLAHISKQLDLGRDSSSAPQYVLTSLDTEIKEKVKALQASARLAAVATSLAAPLQQEEDVRPKMASTSDDSDESSSSSSDRAKRKYDKKQKHSKKHKKHSKDKKHKKKKDMKKKGKDESRSVAATTTPSIAQLRAERIARERDERSKAATLLDVPAWATQDKNSVKYSSSSTYSHYASTANASASSRRE